MESFYYFGYASNLDVSTLEGRLKSGAKLLGLASLPHYGFRFDHPNPDGSARANIIPSPHETVYGLLFEVPLVDKAYFWSSEPGYDFVSMQVATKNGFVEAYVFISPSHVANIFPDEKYLEVILRGGKANGLPASYLAQVINRAGKTGFF